MDACFQNRIHYKESLDYILNNVCSEYKIGRYKSYSIITVGYEDLNLKLTTDKNDYFIKIFNSTRSWQECKRYANILAQIEAHQIYSPKILTTNNQYLYKTATNTGDLFLCVMEYIEGQTLYDSKTNLSEHELRSLAMQVAKINQINIKPEFIYDGWACNNFAQEYKKNEPCLTTKEKTILEPINREFNKIPFDKLPHCFIHGDIINTNVIQNQHKKLFIIDFAVANFAPRIQELAVLMCNIFYHEEPIIRQQKYTILLNEYQKYNTLLKIELNTLPSYINIAHAMHFLCATSQKRIHNNLSKENEYWIQQGAKGLGIINTNQFA